MWEYNRSFIKSGGLVFIKCFQMPQKTKVINLLKPNIFLHSVYIEIIGVKYERKI